MIVKSFDLSKNSTLKFNIFLFYGKNEGLKSELISNNFLNKFNGVISKYDESEFINNYDNIISQLLNKSFFEDNKILIISRVSDKVLKYVQQFVDYDLNNVKIILKSSILDKRSKLRNFAEKSNKTIIIPVYEDSAKDLYNLIINFLNINKIKMSREAINLLVNRSSGDRNNLKIELEKILNYSISNKSVSYENVQKISNLAENYNVNQLANYYLSKNTKNVAKILNENNYSDEDCLLIIKTILNKSKKLLDILQRYKEEKNLDSVISATKPAIFWKDKENVKIQVNNWLLKDLKNKIYELNDIEFLVKSNTRNSLNIVSDFILNY